MACGCKARAEESTDRADAVQRVDPGAPYDTLPTEACLLCADKHIGMACAEAFTASDPCVVLGELELARRHLLAADEAVGSLAAGTLYAAAAAADGWRSGLDRLSCAVASLLEQDTGRKTVRGALADVSVLRLQDTNNQLVGVVRLGAACRMARELGYMPKNRPVIIGDLVAAAEQLVRHDDDLGTLIRNLRHAVQTAPRADLSADWLAVCQRAARTLPPWRSPGHADLLVGLRAYLGLPADFIPGVEK